jgi:hypothetical protein
MLSVTGSVSIEGEGTRLLVTGEGSEVTIDVATERRTSVASLARVPGMVRTLRTLSAALVATNMTVRITRGGKTLATIGGSRPSGLLGRVLRIDRFRLGK